MANEFNGDQGPTPRYANLDEMKSEFASYRVNRKDTGNGTPRPVGFNKADMVTNDPITLEKNNQTL